MSATLTLDKSNQKLDLIHTQLLKLLEKFDSFCLLNDLHYTLHGGTLLGAIRNKQFISWDDDADVAMNRKYFDDFIRIFKEKNTDPGLELDTTSAQRPMLWLKEEGQIPVWLDIFVYDFISETPILQKSKIFFSICFLGLMKTRETMKVFRKGAFSSGFSRAIGEFLYYTGLLIPQNRKIALANNVHKNYFLGTKKLIYRSNDQFCGLCKIIKAEYMTKYKRIRFEGLELEVSSDFHHILSSCYGKDYLTPRRDPSQVSEAHDIYRSLKK